MEGSRVGPYRVGTLLGAGGMGQVYSATAEEPADGLPAGTRVALKVIHPHLIEEEDFLERFLREAEAGRRIRHANVVRTVGAGSASVDGRPRHFIAMEYVEGRTLRALLGEMGRVPEALLREVGRQVARGLGAIHDAGVLHRDLKPDNVLITADHEVKIMDLGVARLADASLLLTRTGAFVGSIPYAAPECFRASLGPRDRRADLHALGLILHELATGSAPYEADDVPGAIRRVLEERPRRLGEVAPQVSPFLEEVVGVLLEKDPTKRFPDAGTLLRVLEEGEAGEWWASRSRSPGAEGRRFARRVCLPRETRVHGRDADLSQLRDWFGRARSGGGGTVLVEGEAGIGKSRLVDEFAAELARGEEDVLFLVGGHPPGGAATDSGALAGAFRDHLGADGAGRYLRHIPLLAPAFDALLRGDRTPEGAEPLNRESMQTCFVEVLRGLAEERPVLLLVEDLHFAPAEARSLFAALAHAVGGRRVLLVGTARPGLDPRWISDLERGAGLRRMTLGRLGPGDLAAMLTEHLGSRRLAEELADRISAKSDGNPFFVFEVLRALREGGLLARQRDGSWETTGVLEGIEVPDSVLDLVRARLADLGEEERGVLEVGACAGFEFDPLLAGEVLGMPRIPLLRLLGRVEARSRLVRAAGARFVFDHHLVQEVLLGGMSEPLREEYHAALAAALEARASPPGTPPAGDLAVAVCTHFLAARRGPEGLRHLDAALARLESCLQAERAWELVRRALDVPGAVAGTDRADLLLRGARYLTLLGRTVPQREAIEEARQLADAAGDPRRRVASRALLGWSLWCSGAFLEAEEVLRKGLDLARETGNVAGERWVVSNLLTVHLWQERLDEAEADLDRMEVLLRGEAPPAEVVAFHGNWGLLLQKRGRFEEALRRTGAALEAARATGSRSDMGSALGNQGALLWNLGRGAEARERFERQADLARSAGDRRGETNAIGMLGALLRELGLPEEAGRCIHRHRMLAEERADGYARALAAGNEGLLALDLGEAERACGAFEDAADRFRGLGLGSCLAASLRFMAVAAAEAGRPAAAASFLAGSLEAAREAGDSWEEAMTRLEGTAPPEGGWEPVEATVLAAEETRPFGDRLAARLGLHLRTGREPHLAEARRILDVLVANAPPECREPMRSRVRVHRMVERAWESRPSRG